MFLRVPVSRHPVPGLGQQLRNKLIGLEELTDQVIPDPDFLLQIMQEMRREHNAGSLFDFANFLAGFVSLDFDTVELLPLVRHVKVYIARFFDQLFFEDFQIKDFLREVSDYLTAVGFLDACRFQLFDAVVAFFSTLYFYDVF